MTDNDLTPLELGQELKINPGTLANWRSAGIGPEFYKVGPLVRYRRADVEEWVAGCTDAAATAQRRSGGAA